MTLKADYISNNKKFRLSAVALSGILSSVAFFYPDLYILQWISCIPFFTVLISYDAKPKTSFLYGFLLNFIKSVIVFTMFFQLLNLDFDVEKPIMFVIIVMVIISVAAVQSIIFGLASVTASHIFKKSSNLFLNSALVSAVFTFSEYSKTLFERIPFFDYLGFPWVMTYITQQKFTVGIQSASLFGAHFITLLVLLSNIIISYLILKKDTRSKKSAIIFLIIFLLNISYGAIVINNNDSKDEISVTVYQDNVSSYSKWKESPSMLCNRFISDIDEYLSNNKTDIVLLSETIFPITLNSDTDISSNAEYIKNNLIAASKKHNIKIVCGAFNKKENNRYNSLFLFDNGKMSEEIYNKQILVPFGEYIPLENTISRIIPSNIFNLSGSSLSSGNSQKVILTDKAKIGTLICFDSIFDYTASEAVLEGAQVLLISTNDSWYNDSTATKQHFGHAIFRAVETRRSVARCAATGISGFVDPYGKVILKTELLKKDIVTENIQLRNDKTLFVRFGYLYLYIILLITSVMCIIKSKKQ